MMTAAVSALPDDVRARAIELPIFTAATKASEAAAFLASLQRA
jgi:hypothetical protein